jgi:LytR cell envelope-related transcriptional attenuator
VDAPLPNPEALIRPWRTATLVASLVAALELVLLLVAAVLLLAKPLSHAMDRHAESVAATTPKRALAAVTKPTVATPKLMRDETKVFVLNGNGRSGAAAAAAARLQSFGYHVPGTGNAPRSDYANTVVMYKPGFRGDALRLARDLHIKVVGPLDGLKPSELAGGQLAVLLGAA